MKRLLIITRDPIDEPALTKERQASNEAGVAITFSGIVRATEGQDTIEAIHYEAYEKMATHQFNKLFDTIKSQWPIESIRLIHRIGTVKVNEPSLWVEVISGHRGEAFAACQWLINETKKKVPIWKQPQTVST
ncbi:MAG: Molybdopterin synthase catalytic subunit [Verrucomicrobia subdivision 3 bacterium]|nr:Molybdopterin synthase catalytic subunit [Limisphaerales bacterium]MCS1417669.1 Molybdopterin synthase catalytic subunit [Limisphaerales bacterium]